MESRVGRASCDIGSSIGVTNRALTARDLATRTLTARNLTARNLTARNLTARNLTARNLISRSIVGRTLISREMSSRDLIRRDLIRRDLIRRDALCRRVVVSPGAVGGHATNPRHATAQRRAFWPPERDSRAVASRGDAFRQRDTVLRQRQGVVGHRLVPSPKLTGSPAAMR